jgi:hypothetical protein
LPRRFAVVHQTDGQGKQKCKIILCLCSIRKIEIDKWCEGCAIKTDPGNDYVAEWVKNNAEWFRQAWNKSLCRHCQTWNICATGFLRMQSVSNNSRKENDCFFTTPVPLQIDLSLAKSKPSRRVEIPGSPHLFTSSLYFLEQFRCGTRKPFPNAFASLQTIFRQG